LLSGTGGTVSQLALANNGSTLQLTNGTYKFTGNLLLGNDCLVTNGTGLVTTTCANNGTSDAVLRSSLTFASAFVAKVTADDAVNTSDTAGAAAFNAITDWFGFSNVFRTWGRDGDAFPAATNRDACNSTLTCRIWDWSLATAGTVIRNTSLDGMTQNPAFTANAACPTDGDDFVDSATYTYDAMYLAGLDGLEATNNTPCTTGQTCKQRYLKAALEDLLDGEGDDDGLCESGETCTYAPNFGAYQGHGLRNPCTFTDGAITGVTLLGFNNNGR
jgi:hypothetical protein